MRFDDVAGYDLIKQRLKSLADAHRLPHAMMISSSDGAGALSIALALAQYANCTDHHDGEPCGKCSACIKYELLAHPDLFFLFPIVGGDKKSCDDYLKEWRENAQQPYLTRVDWLNAIKAGNSQAMIYSKENVVLEERMSYKIAEGEYRVLIIWQPEKMHEALSNKLLKLIEEPPKDTLIILVSIEPELLLPTIKSRVQEIELPLLTEEEVVNALIKLEGDHCDIEKIREAAHLSCGQMRKALDELNNKGEREEHWIYFVRMLSFINPPKPLVMRRLAEEFADLGREYQVSLLKSFASYFRELYMYPLGISQITYLNQREKELAIQLSGCINGANIMQISNEIDVAIRHIMQHVNSKMVFFDLFLRFTNLMARQFRQKQINISLFS